MSIDVGKIPWNRRKLPLHSEQFVVNYLKMVLADKKFEKMRQEK